MKLKEYQSETLAVLRRFFEEARVAGPRNAYEAITRDPEQTDRLGRYAGAYTSLARLPEVPYVCLRLPTGGGKTILAAHAVALARDAWIEKDHPLVLWLVPSNTIRIQTAQALKSTRHPYRQALDESFSGRVRVFDITDFSHIRPHDLRDHCCIVVGTIQALRVTNTEGRKVYAHNENLEPHFAGIPETVPGLERREDGGIKLSFANLLHVHRPLMIVDEAHNAVTGPHPGDAGARESMRDRRVHRHPPRPEGPPAQQYPAQRVGPGAQDRGDDQAADPALRARYLAGGGERRHRGPRLAREECKGRRGLHPSLGPLPGPAEEPGGDGRCAEGPSGGGRRHRAGTDRGRDRRPAGAGRHRPLRPRLRDRARDHH